MEAVTSTQETQPAHSEGQGEADGLVTEGYTDVTEQQSEPLEVLTDSVNTPESNDETPSASAFSSSSDESDEDADDEGAEEGDEEEAKEGDDDGAERDDDEAAEAANLKSQTNNYGLWEPQQEPYRAVLGFRDDDDTIYRPNPSNPWNPVKLHPDSDSDPEERQRTRLEFQGRKVKPHKVIRPSPLRTASSPDSPISPKKITEPTDNVGILPEPISELPQDECPVSPLSDHELPPRPQTPTPPAYAIGRAWSEEEDYDDQNQDWLKEAIESVTGSRRASLDSSEQIPGEDQAPADEGDEVLTSQEPLSPVSPITPVSEADNETRMIVYSDDVDETLHQPEASDYDTEYDNQTSQQADTAPESFDPIFVGAEEHDKTERKKSPTSPDFFGPEPLTGLTPQEGIDAFWEWRERNRPNHRIFRTNRNPGNQDKSGDMTPTTPRGDTSEAQTYLTAQRLDAQQLVNMQQRNVQGMAKRSHQISEAIKFDLESTVEYVKLRMLKYRYERNQYYNEATYNYERVGRREKQINHLAAENREIMRQFDHMRAEYDRMEPFLQAEVDKRQLLKAEYRELKLKYQQQAEMSEAYMRAARTSGEELRQIRARPEQQAAPLQFSSIMEVISQAPVTDTSGTPGSDRNENPRSDTNDESKPDSLEEPKSDASQQTKKAARAKYTKSITPGQFASFMETFGQRPVSGTNEQPKRIKHTKRAAPSRFSDLVSFEEFDLQENPESDARQYPKSAPPTYSSRMGPPPPFSPLWPGNPTSRRPAPENEVNWPLADRPAIVDFMTEWINDHRESLRPNDTPNPLQKAQLDRILGIGFLSWDQLIKELLRLGYTIRPDHLANALSNPPNISAYGLPQPNTAVLYEARRLQKHNAVKELMDENLDLKRKLKSLEKEAETFRTLADVMDDLKRTKESERELQQHVHKLEGFNSSFMTDNQELIKALAKVSGGEDLEGRVALQAQLEETRQTLNEALNQAVSPKSPDPWTGNFNTIIEEKLALAKEGLRRRGDELEACHEHGKLLKSEVDDLSKKLSDSDARHAKEISGHRESYKQLVRLSAKKLGGAKLAAGNSSQTGDAKSSSSIEDALAACREHGKVLQSSVDDLTQQLSESRVTIADLEGKLAAHDNDQIADATNDQAGAATGDQTQVEALKKKILELEQELAESTSQSQNELEKQLASCRSHGGQLQERIDELENELEVQGMLQQGNAGSNSDFLDHLKAADQYAEDLQEKVDELELQLADAKNITPHSSDELEKQLAACRSHGETLRTRIDEREKELKKSGASEDLATLRKELAEAREKNEKLGLDMSFLQIDLSKAQKNYDVLREKVKPELLEEPAPASDRGSSSPSHEVENHGAPLEVERFQLVSDSDDGSMGGLKDFVFGQSDSSNSSDVDIVVDTDIPLKSRPQDASARASERAQATSPDGSVSNLEDSVSGQSDGTSNGPPKQDSGDESDLDLDEVLSPAITENLKRSYAKDNRLKLEDVPDSASGIGQGPQTNNELENEDAQDAESPETSPVEPDSAIEYYTGSDPSDSNAPVEGESANGRGSLPDSHNQAPRFRRIDEDRDRDGNEYDDEDDDEDDEEDDDEIVDEDCKECEQRARELVRANDWLQKDSKRAWNKVEFLQKKLDDLKKKPLPARGQPAPPQAPPQQLPAMTSEPAPPPQAPPQQQQSPTATETETRTAPRPATRMPRPLPVVREPVPLPTEAPRRAETMTANQIGRRAAMYQSLSYIAKAQRRRVIRVRQFEEEQARIRLIVRRAAAIFGEEGLPYVPVEKRYKPMARA
jgi:hypothetical protein